MSVRKHSFKMFQELSFFCFNSIWMYTVKLCSQDSFWTGWLLGHRLSHLACPFPREPCPYVSFGGMRCIANGPCSSEGLNLHHRCEIYVFYTHSATRINQMLFMWSVGISGILSELVCLLGKVDVAGLRQFPQKMPTRMRILFLPLEAIY